MKDVRAATALWAEARDKVWPLLEWRGRIQQMLHGHAQQSLFVWSAEWQNMADWEAGMARTMDCQPYREWSAEMNKLRVYGSEREVFKIFEPRLDMDATPGQVEVRSSYMVQIQNVGLAAQIMQRGQETVWPALGWSGQNQQMLHGKASQSMFVWTAMWPDLAAWEQGMKRTSGNELFLRWYKDWNEIVDFGGPREIFRNL